MRNIQFELGKFYHLNNRGVEKRNIFLDDNDRWRFLQGLFLFNDTKTSEGLLWDLEKLRGRINFKVIKDYFSENNLVRDPLVRIIADCLMPNHYHLLVEEIKEGGISKFMHKLGTGYTMYFNKKYERVGSLFQGTFKAKNIDSDSYLQYLLVYINVMNPGQLIEPNLKEVGIKDKKRVIDFAENYFWSTNKEYLGTRESIIVDKGLLAEFFPTGEQYKNFVSNILPMKTKFDEIDKLLLD